MYFVEKFRRIKSVLDFLVLYCVDFRLFKASISKLLSHAYYNLVEVLVVTQDKRIFSATSDRM